MAAKTADNKNLQHLQEVSDYLTVVVDGKDREFFMSSALLNLLTRHVPEGIDSMLTYHQNLMLRDVFLAVMLAPRDDKNRPQLINADKEAFDPSTVEMTVGEQEKLLDWVGVHVKNFFWTSLQKDLQFLNQNGELLKRTSQNALNVQAEVNTQKNSPSSPNGSLN